MRIVKGKLTNKMWVESEDGRRISKKYAYVCEDSTRGNISIIIGKKSKACLDEEERLIFNKSTEQLLVVSSGYPTIIRDELFQWKRKGKIFWADSNGTIVREDMLYCGSYAQGKLILAKKHSLYYFLNYDLEEVAGPYKSVWSFDEFGYAIVEWDFGISIINKRLEVILTTDKYSRLSALSEQYFLTKYNGKYGVIDITGKEIIPCIYDSITLVSGYFKVEYKGKLGLIDKDGKTIFDCIYPEIIETPDKFVVQDFAKLECIKTKEVTK